MARERKLEAPVTLFAAIETKRHEALRQITYKERRSIADVVRAAITQFIERHRLPTTEIRGLCPSAET